MAELQADPLSGLTKEEAAERLSKYGPNIVSQPTTRVGIVFAFFLVFLKEVHEPTQILLLVVAVIYALVGEVVEGCVAIGIICLMMLCEAVSEYRAKRALRALGSNTPKYACTVRNGNLLSIQKNDIVIGDTIILEAGYTVPADCLLLSSWQLEADESVLTGESTPQPKVASLSGLQKATALSERTNMVYDSTMITKGKGRGLVVKTGALTEAGKIMISTVLVTKNKTRRTPLQKQLKTVALWFSCVAIVCSLGGALLGFVSGMKWQNVVLTALSLAFATIPEELPILVVAVLAIGALSLSQVNLYVKDMKAIESLAFVDTILTDKTGTLTTNTLALSATIISGEKGPEFLKFSSLDGLSKNPSIGPLFRAWYAFVVDPSSPVETCGYMDPFDIAVITLFPQMSSRPIGLKVVSEVPFSPETKISKRDAITAEGAVTFLKGAPENVLSECFAPAEREAFLGIMSEAASQGLRILAYAAHYREHSHFSLLGMLCFEDPLCTGVTKAVAQCLSASVRVAIITGDHPKAASAVATQVGMPLVSVTNCTDDSFDSTHPEEWATRAVAGGFTVFARATPAHKLALVHEFQRNGRIVAVTGDGVNDSPALAQADVSLAVSNATDSARAASAIVLTKGGFPSIVHALREGRRLHENLVLALTFYLGEKLGMVMVFMLCAMWYGFPLSPTQVIVTELFMDIGARYCI